jgi:hypothetical protein
MRTVSKKPRFAICVSAKAEDDLIVGKTYQVLHDKSATTVGCLRVVDESGDDYLYPASRFVLAQVPQTQQNRLLKAVKKRSA